MSTLEYIGAEIDGTETTLSKDVTAFFYPNHHVEVSIENAVYRFTDTFTIDQLDSLIVALKTAREMAANGEFA